MSTYTIKIKEFTPQRSIDGFDSNGLPIITADLQDGYSEFFFSRSNFM